mmetsp:Transcript_97636/g.280961  ORF Transcript_97636/g.280961 Transcript_97636/m.280961 type:complete len:215 (+) Transcript_97636:2805-3449(+)
MSAIGNSGGRCKKGCFGPSSWSTANTPAPPARSARECVCTAASCEVGAGEGNASAISLARFSPEGTLAGFWISLPPRGVVGGGDCEGEGEADATVRRCGGGDDGRRRLERFGGVNEAPASSASAPMRRRLAERTNFFFALTSSSPNRRSSSRACSSSAWTMPRASSRAACSALTSCARTNAFRSSSMQRRSLSSSRVRRSAPDSPTPAVVEACS